MKNKSGFKPVGKNVLLKEEQLDKTSGGIILQNQKKPYKVIVEVGETAFGGLTNPPKVGDRVVHTEAYPLKDIATEQGVTYYVAADDKILVFSEE